MFRDSCWYGQFFLFWYLELVSKFVRTFQLHPVYFQPKLTARCLALLLHVRNIPASIPVFYSSVILLLKAICNLSYWQPHSISHNCTVTYRPITRQRLGKHIPGEAYACNNRTSTARQRISEKAVLPIDRLCFLRGLCRGIIRDKESRFRSRRILGPVLEMVVEGNWEEIARNKLDCAKMTSCVIWSYSETIINPLPGYD
jgi:hypothetical protein